MKRFGLTVNNYQLFDRDIKTIGKHINNALKEELSGFSTVANFATVQLEGDETSNLNSELSSFDTGKRQFVWVTHSLQCG